MGHQTWQQAIGAVERRFARALQNVGTRVFGYTNVAKGSPMGSEDEVEIVDNPDDSDESVGQARQRPLQRTEPWGVRGFPVRGVRALWAMLGSSNLFYVGLVPDRGYGPTDLSEGETCLYSQRAPRAVYADAQGNVALAAGTNEADVPGKVSVAGTTYAMPQWDPFVEALTTFLTSCEGSTDATLAAAATVLLGALTGASGFKSQNAQNG